MAQASNRQQLLDGALECLRTKGYSRTTARDIARAADANLASIGYHFGSKEALLNAAMIQLLEQRNRQVGRLATSVGNGADSAFLARLFEAATAVFRSPRPLFVAFVEAIAQAEHTPELRKELAAHYRSSRSAMAATLTDHVEGDHPEVMASLILAIFDGLLLQWLLEPKSLPAGPELLGAMLDLAGATP